jgi:hypothetical protein
MSSLDAQPDTTAKKAPSPYWHRSVFLMGASFQLQEPVGDLSRRFGLNQNVGFTATYFHKTDLFGEIEFNYLFGRNLKEEASSIFDGIMDSNGQIININGEYSDYLLMERGFWLGGNLGYVFRPLKQHRYWGIMLKLGAGILEHKIRIDNSSNNTPQINGEYAKGYDHLTSGFSLKQTIGITYLPIRGTTNFFIGIEAVQAWTYNRRAYNFNEGKAETAQRFDGLFGLKAGWFIAIYKRDASNYLYF